MDKRKNFPEIDPATWEHPADRAALGAFASLPLAGELVRRLAGSTTERALRLETLVQSARVGDSQFPALHRLMREAASILDAKEIPELFVRLSPEPGAFTLGVDRPFVLLTSAALELWSEDELFVVLSHELGHVLSGHAVYKTLLGILMKAAALLAGSFPLGGAALAAATAALREWDRKSELSADRAALLASQDPSASYRALMKTAGGARSAEMDLNEFFRQARDYENAGEDLDSLYKLLDLLGTSHPYPVLRMTALQNWEKGGAYEAALHGEYPRRAAAGADQEGGEGREGFQGGKGGFSEAASSYAREFSESADPLAQAAGRLMEGIGSLFGGFGGKSSRPVARGAGEGPSETSGAGESSEGPGGGDSAAAREGPPGGLEDFLDEIFGSRAR